MRCRMDCTRSKTRARACEREISDCGLRIERSQSAFRISAIQNRSADNCLPSESLTHRPTLHRRRLQRQPRARRLGVHLAPSGDRQGNGTLGRRGAEHQQQDGAHGGRRGLEALKSRSHVELLTDSVYVGKGMSEWLPKWKANGWQRKERNKLVPIANEALWRKLDALLAKHTGEIHARRRPQRPSGKRPGG